nr:MAG TPA: hypothetical protein [Caudoviricetes sp.]
MCLFKTLKCYHPYLSMSTLFLLFKTLLNKYIAFFIFM